MKDFKKYKLNSIKSPVDDRDWLVDSIYPPQKSLSLPITLDLRDYLREVKDQGSEGTCAAQVASCIKEYHEYKESELEENMSVKFIYNNRENQDSDGMYGRDVMKILKNIGDVTEKDYPSKLRENSKENIPPEMFNISSNFKIEAYGKIENIEELKTALYKDGVCYMSVPVYNYSKNIWRKNGEKRLGAHAMCVVGYNDIEKYFIIRNSWGDDWCDNGYCNMPYDDFDCAWEFWTTIDSNSYVVDDYIYSYEWLDKLWLKIKKILKFIFHIS